MLQTLVGTPYQDKWLLSFSAMRRAGRIEGFLAAAAIWAVSNACIGATPAAYAADVMPKNVSGLGLGIYRCAGDMGEHVLQHMSNRKWLLDLICSLSPAEWFAYLPVPK